MTRVRPVGLRAALVDVTSPVEAAGLAAWARTTGIAAEEIVPAAATVLFDGVDVAGLRIALDGWTPAAVPEPGALVEVPVRFDGPDLAYVADSWHVSPAQVGARLGELELVSAFCGFAPGFSYLAGLPEALRVPRLDAPRARVAPGSVALAGEWCGIYPTASPGGWRIVGRTDVVLWEAMREPPALLPPGTRVVLVPC